MLWPAWVVDPVVAIASFRPRTKALRSKGTQGRSWGAQMTELGIDHLADVRAIGQGGFSTVYAARHTLFQRPVAVKVLSKLAKEKDQRRFERECEVMGRMSDHPNVVTVYQAGYTTENSPYLIMELVEGGTLADLLGRRGRLPWRQSVELIAPVCGALARAHDEGILHRDVKPENILVASDGSPKLTDFGIAYLRDATGATSTQITASWLHTAPETFENRRDERSDLYSLASTLHNLIAGTAPFWRPDDESLSPLMMRLVSEQPPALPAELAPSGLVELVLRALAKNPDERPQRASAMADQLYAVIADPPASGAGNVASGANGSPIDTTWAPPGAATISAPNLDYPPPHLSTETVAAPTPSPAIGQPTMMATSIAPSAEHRTPPPSGQPPTDRPSPGLSNRPSPGSQTLPTASLVVFRAGLGAFIVALAATIGFERDGVSLLGQSLAALAIGSAIGSWLSHQVAGQLSIGRLIAMGHGLAMVGAVLIRFWPYGLTHPGILGLGSVLVGVGVGIGSVQAAMSALDSKTGHLGLRIGSVVGAAIGAMLAGAIIRGGGPTPALMATGGVLAVAALLAAASKETPAPLASPALRAEGRQPETSSNSDGLTVFIGFVGGLVFFLHLVAVFERPDAIASHLTVAGFGVGYFGLYAATGYRGRLAHTTTGHLVVAAAFLVASALFYLWLERGLPELAIIGMAACGVALAAGTDWTDNGHGLWLGQLAAGAGALIAGLAADQFELRIAALGGAVGAVIILVWGMLGHNGQASATSTATVTDTDTDNVTERGTT